MASRGSSAFPPRAGGVFPSPQDIISRFRWLLYYISEEFDDENVEQSVFVLRDELGNDYNKIRSSRDLFNVLVDSKLVSPDDLSVLRTLLKAIPRKDLLEKIDEYETEKPVVVGKEVGVSFIGRRDELEDLKRQLQAPSKDSFMATRGSVSSGDTSKKVNGVFITGFSGIGKTTIAAELVARLEPYHSNVTVDLRGLSDIESENSQQILKNVDEIAKTLAKPRSAQSRFGCSVINNPEIIRELEEKKKKTQQPSRDENRTAGPDQDRSHDNKSI